MTGRVIDGTLYVPVESADGLADGIADALPWLAEEDLPA